MFVRQKLNLSCAHPVWDETLFYEIQGWNTLLEYGYRIYRIQNVQEGAYPNAIFCHISAIYFKTIKYHSLHHRWYLLLLAPRFLSNTHLHNARRNRQYIPNDFGVTQYLRFCFMCDYVAMHNHNCVTLCPTSRALYCIIVHFPSSAGCHRFHRGRNVSRGHT